MKQFFKILLYFLIISICIGQRPYYKGEWKKNRPHGNGERLDNFGSKYVGEFKNGKYHGQGVIDYYNKARFEGEFRNGKKKWALWQIFFFFLATDLVILIIVHVI